MTIEILPRKFTVCKLADGAALPSAEFCFTARTDSELSLVCPTELTPENTVAREDGWRGFRVVGQLDFSLIGILAKIAGVLAEEGISIFALSTYDTDYLLVKAVDLDRAVDALGSAGYDVVR